MHAEGDEGTMIIIALADLEMRTWTNTFSEMHAPSSNNPSSHAYLLLYLSIANIHPNHTGGAMLQEAVCEASC